MKRTNPMKEVRPLIGGSDVYAEWEPAHGFYRVRTAFGEKPRGELVKDRLVAVICAHLLLDYPEVRLGIPESFGRVRRIAAFDPDGQIQMTIGVRDEPSGETMVE